MSFPKARIQRFNEISTCAPPPGKYDPKYDVKVKGAVITKAERFVDKVEPALSEASEDSTSTCSVNYNPAALFRTPQLPRKRVPLTPRSATSCGKIARTPERRPKKKLEYDTEKSLIHQIDELTRVHSAQLIEKDREMAMMQKELEEVKAAYSKSENSYINDYNTMKQKYEAEVLSMKNELILLIDDNEYRRVEMEKIVVELQNQVKILEENVLNCNVMNKDLEGKLRGANKAKEELTVELNAVVNELKQTKDEVVSMVELQKADWSTLMNFPSQLDEAWEAATTCIDSLSNNFEEKLKIFQRQIEVENRETNRHFARVVGDLIDGSKAQGHSLEQAVTTLQTTIDGIVTDVDSRINDLIEGSFSRFSDTFKSTLKENVQLVSELEKWKVGRLEDELVSMDLRDQIDILQKDVERLTQQCKKFQVVHKEATKTIQVLSDRLVESENEVERLNVKTEDFNLRKNALEDKVRSVVDENNLLKIDIANLQILTVKEIEQIEKNLLNKVEHYRQTAAQQGQQFAEEVADKQKTIDALTKEIEFNQTKIREMDDYMSECQTQLSKYKTDLQEHKSKLYKAVDELAIAEMNKGQNEERWERLSLKNARLSEEIQNLRVELNNANELENRNSLKMTRLSKEIEELTESSKAMTETIVEKDLKLEAVQSELEDCRSLYRHCSVKMVDLIEEKENLIQEIEIKTSNMIHMSEEYEKMENMIEEERLRNSDLEKGVGELVSDLILEKQRCSQAEINFQDKLIEIEHLKSEIRDAENKNDELLEQVENLESNGVALTDELYKRTNEKTELSAKVSELEKLLETEMKAKEVIVQEKDDMLLILNRQWEEHEFLVNQIESQQEEIAELKRVKDECDEEKSIHQAELQNEIFALQQNLEDTQQHAINLKALEEELNFKLASVKAELSEVQSHKEQRDVSIKDLENKVASLEARCSVLANRKHEYKLYATELEAEKNALKMTIEEKEKMLAESNEIAARIENLEVRLAASEAKNLQDAREISELREKNVSLENIIQPFRQQLLQYEKERDELLVKSENVEKEMYGLQLEHAKLLSHNNHRQKICRVMQLTETIHNLKKENEKLLKEITKLRASTFANKESNIKANVGKENSGREAPKKPVRSKSPNSLPASPLKTRNAH